jgi:imidazolonepropionase-like amidohydrolase
MKKLLVMAVGVALLWSGPRLDVRAQTPASQSAVPTTGTLVIDGATLIDTVGGTVTPDCVVVMSGGRVEAAGPRASVRVPSGAHVIDAKGKFVMPGLTDGHVHLRDWMPELFLAYGVTSVLDLGNPTEWTLALREGVEDGNIRGPRVFTSAGIVNGPPHGKGHHYTVSTPEQATEITAYLASRKADAIKVHAQLKEPEVRAAIAEAHRHNLPVIGHLGIDARLAVMDGIDSIAHSSGIGIAATSDPAQKERVARGQMFGLASFGSMDPAGIKEFVGVLREHNVFIEPDLVTTAQATVPSSASFTHEWQALFIRPELAYVPADNPMRWNKLFLAETASADPALMREGWQKLKSFLMAYVAAGGTIVAGTDTQTFVPAGISLQQELELYVKELGFTPMKAIQAATINNGAFLRRSDLGVLKRGSLADAIIVRDDPTKDIRNLRSIDTVIVNGRVQDHDFHANYQIPIARPEEETSGGNPRPTLLTVKPAVAVQGQEAVSLEIAGERFIPTSVIEFDGKQIPTTFKSRTQLEGQIPSELLHRVGTYAVTVSSPRPDGGASEPQWFIVKFKRPTSGTR